MAGSWTSGKPPQHDTAMQKLIKQHRQLEDEPLHLAVTFDAGRDASDIFLLEVVTGLLGDSVSSERELFEVTYLPAPAFPMDFDQPLHLILTNPTELKIALEENWGTAQELLRAIRSGAYQVVFQDPTGKKVLRMLRQKAKEGASG